MVKLQSCYTFKEHRRMLAHFFRPSYSPYYAILRQLGHYDDRRVNFAMMGGLHDHMPS